MNNFKRFHLYAFIILMILAIFTNTASASVCVNKVIYPEKAEASTDISIKVVVSYSFANPTDIFVGLWKPGKGYIKYKFDTVSGSGSKTYKFVLKTPSKEGDLKLSADTWYYNEATGEWIFTCEKWFTIKIYKRAATRITCLVSAKKIVFGESILVYGELKPAIKGKIRITFLSPKHKSYQFNLESEEDGSYSFNYTPTETGKWSVYAEFLGSEKYKPSTSEQVSFEVIKASSIISISFNATNLPLGETYTFNGSLSPPIKGTRIKIKVNKPSGKTEQLYVTTEEAGYFMFELKLDELGKWNINIIWEGDANHEGTITVVDFNVKRKSMFNKISLTENIQYSDTALFMLKLLGDKNNPLDNKNITIFFYNNSGILIKKQTFKTDSSGIIKYEERINLRPGIYKLIFRFEGDDEYSYAEYSSKLKVEKEKVQIKLLSKKMIDANSDRKILVSINDDDNEPIDGLYVELLLYSENKWFKISDAVSMDGTAVVSLPKEFKTNSYQVMLNVKETDFYENASLSTIVYLTTINVEVLKRPPKLLKIGDTANIDLKLTYAHNGSDVSNAIVYVASNNVETEHTADSKGMAKIALKNDAPGVYKYVLRVVDTYNVTSVSKLEYTITWTAISLTDLGVNIEESLGSIQITINPVWLHNDSLASNLDVYAEVSTIMGKKSLKLNEISKGVYQGKVDGFFIGNLDLTLRFNKNEFEDSVNYSKLLVLNTTVVIAGITIVGLLVFWLRKHRLKEHIPPPPPPPPPPPEEAEEETQVYSGTETYSKS